MDVKESQSMSDTERARRLKMRQASRYADEVKNPCLKESDMSMKCMSDNSYDREKCSTFFQNYKNCRDFWARVEKDRRFNRIYPTLPPPEERENVKSEYFAKWSS